MAHPTRLFHEPKEIENIWNDFKMSLIERSKVWEKIQYVGKDGTKRIDNPKIPLTFEGFKIYCRIHYGEIEQYFTNQDKYYTKFIDICSRIKEEIRDDQIIGGMLGFYNPSITQRLNNLVDKQEQTIKKEQPLFGSKEEEEDE